jgi:hypothetical protein
MLLARASAARQAGGHDRRAPGVVAENRISSLSRWRATMTATHQLAWVLLLVPACFHPNYDYTKCGPNGECPSGLTCNAQQICDKIDSANDASVGVPPGIDAPGGIDGGSGMACYGPSGWQVCFASAPTGSIILPSTINTDGGSPCLGMQPMGWTAPQPAACFIVGDAITVPSGGTKVNGAKPLVLVARSSITIAGVLDVARHKGVTVTMPTDCFNFSQTPDAPDISVGGSGGAGGSFMTRAGNGGLGDGGTQQGLANPADAVAPTHLRGGCPGQEGGASSFGDIGTPGAGGGSVYLVSGGDIALQSAINASGAGGGGGRNRAGGSGGGSGGMIVLYSATLTPSLTPVLMANGGGGGAGSPGSIKAPDGSDPSVTSPLTPAAGGATSSGQGGQGYSATGSALDGAVGASIGGGGGGGGGAAGYIRSNHSPTGATASPPADIIP